MKRLIIVGGVALSMQATLFAQGAPPGAADRDCSIPGEREQIVETADALGVCDDLRQLKLTHGNLSGAEKIQELEDRTERRANIENAVTELILNTDDLMEKLNQGLEEEHRLHDELEDKRYRRTKWANAVLGAAVGVVGAGMQLSSRTATQHAGDWISVAGGAITIFFQVCTAEIDKPSSEKLVKDEEDFMETSGGERPVAVEEDVWKLLDEEGKKRLRNLSQSLESLEKYRNPKGCHIWKPEDGKLHEIEKDLEAIEESVLGVNRRGLGLLTRADILSR